MTDQMKAFLVTWDKDHVCLGSKEVAPDQSDAALNEALTSGLSANIIWADSQAGLDMNPYYVKGGILPADLDDGYDFE